MLVVSVFDRPQPLIQEPVALLTYGGLDATAAIVPADDDVFHFQIIDGIGNYAKKIEIGVDHQIGNIAMDKDITRLCSRDLFGRNAAIGTTDPKKLGLLFDG